MLLIVIILMATYLFRHKIFSITTFKDYYTIGVILNTVELSEEDFGMAQLIIGKRLEQINLAGGVMGRELRVQYLDDKSNSEVAYQKVKETIDDEHLIGYVGCWSSSRAYAISALIGPAKVPFIGEYALTSLFDDYPSMFTAENGIIEQGGALKFILKGHFKRAGYIGKEGDLFSLANLEQMTDLAEEDSAFSVVGQYHFPIDHQYTDAEFSAIVKELKAAGTDFMLVSIESGIAKTIILGLRKAGLDVPVFVGLGDAGFVVAQARAEGQDVGELYDVNIAGVSGTLNLRLQEVLLSLGNNMKYTQELEFQLSFGARFADAIGMIAEAANAAPVGPTPDIRAKIVKGLHRYIGGEQIFRGWYADWYFTKNKSGAQDMFIAWKPKNLPHHILTPEQLVFLDDSLKAAPVLYTHMDLVRIDRISDNDGTFHADFFFEIFTSTPFSIDDVDFTNAARSETDHTSLIDISLIRERKVYGEVPMYNSLYKVSGMFIFKPDLHEYPFDKQKFVISFQPRSALQPFMIQPPIGELRDTVFESGGWELTDHFVGFNHDIISFINPLEELKQTLPVYKFSYIFILKRARIDFFLKILIPLLVILMVTYFSVYIPFYRFETIGAIQVTALLASIALNLSTYKPELEHATVSDKIFVFTYLMITSLIGTSILRYVRREKHDTENEIARFYQLYVFPIILMVFTMFVASS